MSPLRFYVIVSSSDDPLLPDRIPIFQKTAEATSILPLFLAPGDAEAFLTKITELPQGELAVEEFDAELLTTAEDWHRKSGIELYLKVVSDPA